MPQGRLKSGRFRKVFVKTPGGKTTVHHRERKPSAAKCAVSGKRLLGVPRERPAVLGKLAKSARRPERPFGGMLSSGAMRDVLKERAEAYGEIDGTDAALFAQGRLCMKLAGRDAGLLCVIVENKDDGFAVVEGQTRRRRVNLKHLQPLGKVLDVKSGSFADVKSAFATLDIELRETKAKKAGERPRKVKAKKPKKEAKPKAAPQKAAEKKADVKKQAPSKAPAKNTEAKKESAAKAEEKPAEVKKETAEKSA